MPPSHHHLVSHRALPSALSGVDKFIALSQSARKLFLTIGLLALLGLGGVQAEERSASSSAPSMDPHRPLRVVAWNIEWFPGQTIEPIAAQEAAQIPLVQEALRQLDPDILIASEIRDWDAFEEAVRAVPGLRIHVVSNFRDTDTGQLWRQQIAIASRLRCRAAWAEEFAPTIPALRRGFAFAALEDPVSGKLLMTYGVHLKSNRSRNEAEAALNFLQRNESTEQLLAHMEVMERVTFGGTSIRGWILGGDYNTNHDGQFGDRVVARLEEAGFWNSWAGIPREKRLTWRGNDAFEGTTFDYIMTRGLGQPKATMGGTDAATSDHDAVVLSIDLEPAPATTP